jgi:hypothetical protein
MKHPHDDMFLAFVLALVSGLGLLYTYGCVVRAMKIFMIH